MKETTFNGISQPDVDFRHPCFFVANEYEAKNLLNFSQEQIDRAKGHTKGFIGRKNQMDVYLSRPMDSVDN